MTYDFPLGTKVRTAKGWFRTLEYDADKEAFYFEDTSIFVNTIWVFLKDES